MIHKPRQIKLFSAQEWAKLTRELSLTPRQAQIVRLLFEGLSDERIAQRLKVTAATVRTHLRRLYAKFHLCDRTELVLYIFWRFRQSCQAMECPRKPCTQIDEPEK